jgi:hypothetical protein
VLVHQLFQPTCTGVDFVNLLRVRIRLFLSAFDRLDLATRKKPKLKPRWVSSYNYMCALNIPDIVSAYGPYRLIYEGKWCSEGYLRVLKPMAQVTSHKNRTQNLLHNLQRQKGIEGVVLNHADDAVDCPQKENIEKTPTNRHLIYRKARRYKNKAEVLDHYCTKTPLSCVVYRQSAEDTALHFGIAYLAGRNVFVCPIEKINSSSINVGECLLYWQWNLVKWRSRRVPLESILLIDYAILLPLVFQIDTLRRNVPDNYYTIITKEWSMECIAETY